MNKMIMVMTAKSGKTRESIASAKAGVDYVNNKYGLKAEIHMQVFGGIAGTIYLIADYEDLASAQAMQSQVLADEKYWELVQKMADVMESPPTITLLQPV